MQSLREVHGHLYKTAQTDGFQIKPFISTVSSLHSPKTRIHRNCEQFSVRVKTFICCNGRVGLMYLWAPVLCIYLLHGGDKTEVLRATTPSVENCTERMESELRGLWYGSAALNKLNFTRWSVRSLARRIHAGQCSSCYVRSLDCEKRRLASSCLSVRPHGKTWLPLDGFSWNLIFQCFSKICWANSSLNKIWQE